MNEIDDQAEPAQADAGPEVLDVRINWTGFKTAPSHLVDGVFGGWVHGGRSLRLNFFEDLIATPHYSVHAGQRVPGTDRWALDPEAKEEVSTGPQVDRACRVSLVMPHAQVVALRDWLQKQLDQYVPPGDAP